MTAAVMTPVTATITQFCHQTWQLDANVQLIQREDQRLYLVTDQTPFHPVSHIWPDHPADRGFIKIGAQQIAIVDCLVGAVELNSGQLCVDKAISVKRNEPGWVFVVVHCLDESGEYTLNVADKVTLVVDKAYQQSLSRGHSAGHLAFLALNKVLSTQGYWRKDAERKDPHGYNDFNSYAQETSFVTPDRCLDSYRLGKTLRKRGLNSAEMVEQLNEIETLINQQVSQWLLIAAEVEMRCDGDHLTDSRYWQCDLGEQARAIMPCGGSHISNLSELESVQVKLQETQPNYIEMQTDVIGMSK
ncbi:hypothetical protein VII00023_10045 [Vibrio ichthyoenteri ATCC 700023]|uniref:Metal-dependent hydrolase n=1 Tax=Vibrio ichthyoenteri ATCC 700023 TaxID=870968 RepID=F9RWB6_9VIBR|nr:hypothetical protein [Vibrio ichthyoenteri]EGU49369.1 hypothetical protein VII00023_10045 [Vibrio ichthyoenteri ATCC 700023]